MKKKTILICWIVGFIIALIGAGLFVPSIVAAANHCTINQFGEKSCSLPVTDPLTYVGVAGVIVLIISGLLHAIAWIGALVRSARRADWLWFVIVLIFSSLGTLIYAIITPAEASYEVSAPH